jgi:hypothetical protein
MFYTNLPRETSPKSKEWKTTRPLRDFIQCDNSPGWHTGYSWVCLALDYIHVPMSREEMPFRSPPGSTAETSAVMMLHTAIYIPSTRCVFLLDWKA